LLEGKAALIKSTFDKYSDKNALMYDDFKALAKQLIDES
jgi:hypothetical protein